MPTCSTGIALTQPLSPLPTTGVTEADSPLPAQSADSGLDHAIPPHDTPTNPAPTDGASGNASATDINSPTNGDPASNTPITPIRTNPTLPCPNDGARGSGPLLPNTDLEITTIDIYTLLMSITVKIPSTGDDTTASVLAERGFIGNVPFKPTVTVSIKTLDLY